MPCKQSSMARPSMLPVVMEDAALPQEGPVAEDIKPAEPIPFKRAESMATDTRSPPSPDVDRPRAFSLKGLRRKSKMAADEALVKRMNSAPAGPFGETNGWSGQPRPHPGFDRPAKKAAAPKKKFWSSSSPSNGSYASPISRDNPQYSLAPTVAGFQGMV